MATLTVTPIRTFTSGETVTPTKLNELSQPTVALTAGTIVDADVSASAAIAASKLSTATQQSLVPAGAVMPFAMNSAPSGWLAANGDAVSRSTYAALFSAIGTTHGVGDGSTTFNLPDLRGIFVRGSGSQTISGITYNKTFAAKEGDAIRNITGAIAAIYRVVIDGGAATSALTASPYGSPAANGTIGTHSGDSATVSFDASRSVPTASENRPANIALLYCIKF